MIEPIDVHWETVAGHKYLRSDVWNFDPSDGENATWLRESARVFIAAADYLEREERSRDLDREAERLDGYRHATGASKSGVTGLQMQERMRALFEAHWRDYYSRGGLIRY